MTSGGNNFNYFAENQLTKFSAIIEMMREISVTHNFQGYFSRTFQPPGPGIFKKKTGLSRRRGNPDTRSRSIQLHQS